MRHTRRRTPSWAPLGHALELTPAFVVVVEGPEHRVVFANRRAVEHLGGEADRRPARESLPSAGLSEVLAPLEQARTSGTAVRLEQLAAGAAAGPGVVARWLSLACVPVDDDAVLVVAVECGPHPHARADSDVEDRRAAAGLRALSSVLARAATTHDVLDPVLAVGAELLGAVASRVALRDGQAAAVPFAARRPEAEVARTGEPLALATVDALLARFPDEAVARLASGGVEQSWVWWPLLASDGLALGVLCFAFDAPRHLRASEHVLLGGLAEQCAMAVERAWLLSAADQGASALRHSEQRYGTLIEAISLDVWATDVRGRLVSDMPHWRSLTGSDEAATQGWGWLSAVHPDDRAHVQETWASCVRAEVFYELEFRIRSREGGWRYILARAAPVRSGTQVLEWIGTTADVTRERLAVDRTSALQRCSSALTPCQRVDQVVQAALGPVADSMGARGALVVVTDPASGVPGSSWRGYPRLDAALLGDVVSARSWPGVEALLQRRHAVILDADMADVVSYVGAQGRALFDMAVEAGDRSWAVLPLVAGETVLGAMVLGLPEPQALDVEGRAFLTAAASQVALALDRTLLFEQQRSIATVLQRALRPARLPTVDGLAASLHTRAGSGNEVGGDWAELLPLADGTVAVILGDVMGRGVRAAATMGQVRTAVRAYAVLDPDPVAVLGALDRLFVTFDNEELVTLHYSTLGRDGVLRYANAGHPPPLLVSSGAAVFLDGATSTPVGIAAGGRVVRERRLGRGDVLLVYSDGLVETRTRSLAEGLPELREVVEAAVTGPGPLDLAALCDRIVVSMGSARADDDVTLLAVELTAEPPSAEVEPAPYGAPLRLTSGPAAAGHARALVRDRCLQAGMHGDALDCVVLLTSELVTNAVLHGRSEVTLAVRLLPGEIRVEVGDDNHQRPVHDVATAEDLGGRGMGIVEAVSSRWGVVGVGGGKVVWFTYPLPPALVRT